MTVLGIDTSSTDLSVCLSIDGSPLSTVCRYVRNSHAEHITQAVKLALNLGGIDADSVTHIAVSVGPGSFTGLRIGLSFVKGFCMMTERKILPLSSLMVLARSVGCRQRGQKIFTALDARQGRIHWGSFIIDDNASIQRLSDDRLSPPEELLNELSPDDLLVTDTMGYSRSTVFNIFKDKPEFAGANCVRPQGKVYGNYNIIEADKAALQRGLSCAAFAFDARHDESVWKQAQEITPNYLQMSAAEEKICS